MGSICATPELRKQNQVSKQIDKKIRNDEHGSIGDQKLLLLGTGECGKSTIIKQMQILHREGFSQAERTNMKPIINSTIIVGIRTIIEAMTKFGYFFSQEQLEVDAKFIENLIKTEKDALPFTEETVKILKRLWTDKNVEMTFARKSDYQLNDNISYFMEAIDRVAAKDYMPTNSDLLNIRVPTSGVVQINFPVKGVMFRVVDVGGQRSERRKWIHLFENVDAVIYIVAINEFDQTLLEDGQTNRLSESIELFKHIIATRWFIKSAIILFLNKRDLFEQKIRHASIKLYFKDYKGSNSYEECMAYIKEYFDSLRVRGESKSIYLHETCATDTKQIEQIIDSVMFTVLEKNFKKTAIV
ncbi:unnamed protein product [Auanema sp. JU1783]|nr:unnamed protein product [Auanema sp. JU1783]